MKSKAFLVKAEHLKKLRDGLLPNERATWTLSQALGQELEFRALSRRATSEAPNRTAGKHLLRLIGANKRLKQIAAISVIENFQMQRLKEGRKPKTVNNEVYLLSAILTKAGLWDQVERHSSHCRLRRRTAVRH